MTVVVADTSPLNYLVLIEAIEVLPQLYERICVPEAVIAELRSSDAPLPVQQWAAVLPAWSKCEQLQRTFSPTRGGSRFMRANKPPWRWPSSSKPIWFSWTNEPESAWRVRTGFV